MLRCPAPWLILFQVSEVHTEPNCQEAVLLSHPNIWEWRCSYNVQCWCNSMTITSWTVASFIVEKITRKYPKAIRHTVFMLKHFNNLRKIIVHRSKVCILCLYVSAIHGHKRKLTHYFPASLSYFLSSLPVESLLTLVPRLMLSGSSVFLLWTGIPQHLMQWTQCELSLRTC